MKILKTSRTTRKATSSELLKLTELGLLCRAGASAIGASGIVAAAKELGLDELVLEASMLAEQFESFAKAISRAVVKIEGGE